MFTPEVSIKLPAPTSAVNCREGYDSRHDYHIPQQKIMAICWLFQGSLAPKISANIFSRHARSRRGQTRYQQPSSMSGLFFRRPADGHATHEHAWCVESSLGESPNPIPPLFLDRIFVDAPHAFVGCAPGRVVCIQYKPQQRRSVTGSLNMSRENTLR